MYNSKSVGYCFLARGIILLLVCTDRGPSCGKLSSPNWLPDSAVPSPSSLSLIRLCAHHLLLSSILLRPPCPVIPYHPTGRAPATAPLTSRLPPATGSSSAPPSSTRASPRRGPRWTSRMTGCRRETTTGMAPSAPREGAMGREGICAQHRV